jgi:hypothetical protein
MQNGGRRLLTCCGIRKTENIKAIPQQLLHIRMLEETAVGNTDQIGVCKKQNSKLKFDKRVWPYLAWSLDFCPKGVVLPSNAN